MSSSTQSNHEQRPSSRPSQRLIHFTLTFHRVTSTRQTFNSFSTHQLWVIWVPQLNHIINRNRDRTLVYLTGPLNWPIELHRLKQNTQRSTRKDSRGHMSSSTHFPSRTETELSFISQWILHQFNKHSEFRITLQPNPPRKQGSRSLQSSQGSSNDLPSEYINSINIL